MIATTTAPADPDKIGSWRICGCGVADDDSDSDGTADCDDLCPADPDKTDPGTCGCGVPDDRTATVTAPPTVIDSLSRRSGQDRIRGPVAAASPTTDSDSDGTADCDDLCPADP